jgi:hypothetical protein
MSIFANAVSTTVFLVLAFLSLALFFYTVEEREYLDKRVVVLISTLSLLAVVVCGDLYFYGATHRVVPPNQRWLFIDTAAGEVLTPVRNPGLTEKPFWFYKLIKFPGAKQQPFCLDFLPALKEGYEIKATVCGTYDASTLDWADQYQRHNFTSAEEMLAFWSNQGKDAIREVFSKITYAELNSDPVAVSSKVGESLSTWLAGEGVSSSGLVLSNWDLTSEAVKAQIDQASAASFQKTVEEQRLTAAEVARKRQLYEVETANLVLQARAVGLKSLFSQLGITDPNAMAQIVSTTIWYSLVQNAPDRVQIVVGSCSPAIAIPK